MESTIKPQRKHLGRNLRRVREILGVKQDTVADQLGVTQQTVSNIESAEEVEDKTFEKIAGILGVAPEAIRNFDEEATINFIQHNHDGSNQSASSVSVGQHQSNWTFNPIDKWVEAMEKNEKLYEKLLKSEQEKVAMLEKLLDKK